MDFKLLHQIGAMGIDRLGADSKLPGCSGVGHSPGKALENLDFPGGQLRSSRARLAGQPGEDLLPACNGRNRLADFFRWLVLDENAVDAGLRGLGEKGWRGIAGKQREARIGRPAPRLKESLQAVGARHRHVEYGEIGRKTLDQRDGVDAVTGLANYRKSLHGLDRVSEAGNRKGMIVCKDDGETAALGVGPVGGQGSLGAFLAGTIIYLTLCAFLLLLTSLFAGAQTPAAPLAGQSVPGQELLKLTGPLPTTEVSPRIEYLLDETGNLAIGDVSSQPLAVSFRPIATATPDFGYTRSAVWLRLRLLNTTTDTSDWRLMFRENFMQHFAAWKVSADGGQSVPLLLIDQDERSDFASRPVQFPELVVPLPLDPGESGYLYVRYRSGGSSELSFSVESAASFATTAARRTAKNFIYYGMVLLLCVISTLAFAITRQVPFIAYTLYSGSALMFIVHADGNGFAYLWPNEPVFNAFASILFGAVLGISCANFARVFLETRIYHPVMDKLLLGIIVIILASLLSSFVVDHMLIKKYLILMVLGAILLATLSGVVAAFHRFKKVRFYVLAWTGVLISAGILSSRHWLGVQISEETQFDSMRIAIVVDATMMGLAIWDSLNQIRRDRHLALKSSLVNAERNLNLNKRLQELEERYQLALELSDRTSRRMRSTIHDLRQPLHALRLSVKGLGPTGAAAGETEQINRTFDYLENLVQDHLSPASREWNATGAGRDEEMSGATGNSGVAAANDDDGGSADAVEELSISGILESVHEMFLPDARAKGLELDISVRETGQAAEPLVLMRIVNNLVVNAIKYTDTGRILIASRDLGDAVEVEVSDTGSGMSAEQFAEAKREGVRLANAGGRDGHGLGLAIVHELAHQHGLSVALDSPRGGGTAITLTIPKTAPGKARQARRSTGKPSVMLQRDTPVLKL